jgi:hypothetical protein
VTAVEPDPLAEAAGDPAAEIRRVYDGREIGATTRADVRAMVAYVNAHGVDPGFGQHQTTDEDRAARLRIAAWADLTALRAEEHGTGLAAELAEDAILLGMHLLDYDRHHGTSTVRPAPVDLIYWTVTGFSRIYTRAAWLAHYERQ